ncbi:hypothetical protein MIMGU_mgv1a0166802mg, partial [Erythranthe guttata]
PMDQDHSKYFIYQA